MVSPVERSFVYGPIGRMLAWYSAVSEIVWDLNTQCYQKASDNGSFHCDCTDVLPMEEKKGDGHHPIQ